MDFTYFIVCSKLFKSEPFQKEVSMLSAVIPILNEADTLSIVLDNLRQIPLLKYSFFILNGCTDQSAEIIQKAKTPYKKNIIIYPDALGFDIPRAVGAYYALKCPVKGVLFLDGDTADDIHHCLNQLARAVCLKHTDLALTNCYPYPKKRFARAKEVLAARGELNRTLGLFHDLGLASPSHGPICAGTEIIKKTNIFSLAVPPLFLAEARLLKGEIKVAAALNTTKYYGAIRDDEHNKLIAETIIGDSKMAKNYYLYNSYDREGYQGYHLKRDFRTLEKLTGKNVPPDF